MGIELLPDYEDLDDKKMLKSVKKGRRKCGLVGHIWSLESFVPPNDYTIVCSRCFPHINSRRRLQSYNLFSTPEKEHG